MDEFDKMGNVLEVKQMRYNISIGLACDHAGFLMKESVKKYLLKHGFEVTDFGTNSEDSCDYADFGHLLATAVRNKKVSQGFAFCGSGNGINITLNRNAYVRSAYCWNPEIAILARAHNDANICTIPARFIENAKGIDIVKAFLTSEFEGGRHQIRIDKITV